MPFELKWEDFTLQEQECYKIRLVFEEYLKYKDLSVAYEKVIREQDKEITELKKKL